MGLFTIENLLQRPSELLDYLATNSELGVLKQL